MPANCETCWDQQIVPATLDDAGTVEVYAIAGALWKACPDCATRDTIEIVLGDPLTQEQIDTIRRQK